jgi:MFS family permease
MLGIETVPAVFYYFALLLVPESPRWLVMRGRDEEAIAVMTRVSGAEGARSDLQAVKLSLAAESGKQSASVKELFRPAMKLVMIIGVSVAILQQITGINAVFFYAPMIFEQSGIGKDAAFMQAVLVGLVNLVFTLVAITLIDRLGRRPLLGLGLAGIACCMLLLSYGFGSATYTLGGDSIAALPAGIERGALEPVLGRTYQSDVEFRDAMIAAIGEEGYKSHQSDLVSAAIKINPTIIVMGILGFVASFAMSLGPVMWVLFSELFPNRIRGIAISFVGLINSATSFCVQLVFPWELENIGNSTTFLIYGVFAVAGLAVVMMVLPETKGRSLEELESELVGGGRG